MLRIALKYLQRKKKKSIFLFLLLFLNFYLFIILNSVLDNIRNNFSNTITGLFGELVIISESDKNFDLFTYREIPASLDKDKILSAVRELLIPYSLYPLLTEKIYLLNGPANEEIRFFTGFNNNNIFHRNEWSF